MDLIKHNLKGEEHVKRTRVDFIAEHKETYIDMYTETQQEKGHVSYSVTGTRLSHILHSQFYNRTAAAK